MSPYQKRHQPLTPDTCAAAASKGDQGQRIWTAWVILAYNLDTLAMHTT